MTSYNSRECRRVKCAKIIEKYFKDGDEFTVNDIADLWEKESDYAPTAKEISRIAPLMNGLTFERRKGTSIKYYTYHGTPAKDMYQRRSRVSYGYELNSDLKYEKERV